MYLSLKQALVHFIEDFIVLLELVVVEVGKLLQLAHLLFSFNKVPLQKLVDHCLNAGVVEVIMTNVRSHLGWLRDAFRVLGVDVLLNKMITRFRNVVNTLAALPLDVFCS